VPLFAAFFGFKSALPRFLVSRREQDLCALGQSAQRSGFEGRANVPSLKRLERTRVVMTLAICSTVARASDALSRISRLAWNLTEASTMNIDNTVAQQAIGAMLAAIHIRLEDATRIARAAIACAQAGSVNQGVTLALDIEQPIHEAGRLLDAVSFLNRFSFPKGDT